MKQAIYKVPDGKLLKIFVEGEGKIESIKITGDFFIYPEESIADLEAAVTGAAFEETTLTKKLQVAVDTNQMELFGVDAASISHTILMTRQ